MLAEIPRAGLGGEVGLLGVRPGMSRRDTQVKRFNRGSRVKFQNQVFENTRVDLDGNEYRNCTFRRCTVVYSGGQVPLISGCDFNGCEFGFSDAAERTLIFMNRMYHGGFQNIIEETLASVRSGPSGGGVKS
ncbi:hypothetical protein DAERI_050099 [Deinococcus aerius]|uniref:Uncharacterized protein n=1 Tax=Deinococcus aerius TaxID=200253 RepID=A0A2I9D5G2_9DEIO|nr:hypothetical protein [Deinococcus aerius]GBF05590.1 hypothetical protein DAERI_050099 [Deinococcus aerius]